jgi:hypothetical protein
MIDINDQLRIALWIRARAEAHAKSALVHMEHPVDGTLEQLVKEAKITAKAEALFEAARDVLEHEWPETIASITPVSLEESVPKAS